MIPAINKEPESNRDALTRQDRQMIAVFTFFQVVDGLALYTLGLVAGSLTREWHITTSLMGIVLAAAQFGSIAAAAVVGPLTERISERVLLILVAGLLSVGSLCTAVAVGPSGLLVSRILTGIGLGAAIPLSVGYISRRIPLGRRATSIAIVLAGLPIGELLVGLLGSWMIPTFGWRAPFALTAVASAIVIPVLVKLPREPSATVAPVTNQGHLPTPEMPVLRGLWHSAARAPLVATVVIAFLASLIIYFLFSWLPYLLNRSGFSVAIGSLSASVLAVGSMCGSLACGRLCDRISPYRVLGGAFFFGAVAMVLLAVAPRNAALVLGLIAGVGFFVFGAYMAISMFVSIVFPKHSHVHVLGTITVLTRCGGMIGPVAIGVLLQRLDSSRLFFLAGGLAIAIAMLFFAIEYGSGGYLAERAVGALPAGAESIDA